MSFHCRRFLSWGAVLVLLAASAGAVPAHGQDDETAPAGATGQEMGPEQPGPHHAELAKAVGTWKTRSTMQTPGGTMTYEGKEEIRSINGGLWILTRHTSEVPMPMEGHGIDGYDTVKGKYVGVWIDSWGSWMMAYEGERDPSGRIVSVSRSYGMDGELTDFTMISEWLDENTRSFKMWQGPAEGTPMMEMVSTRL